MVEGPEFKQAPVKFMAQYKRIATIFLLVTSFNHMTLFDYHMNSQ